MLALAFVACSEKAEDPADVEAVTTMVEQFGVRLAYVSLLGPMDELQESIRTQYGPYATNLLLSAWLTDPRAAPGREASSPWPDRIEVTGTRRIRGGEYEVRGEILYVTSIGEPAVLREPIIAMVVQGQDEIWRISQWNER